MNSLTVFEQNELTEYESVIERGLKTFVEVGTALLAIREAKLYRLNYGTFEEYCQERWGMVRRQADRLISAAEVSENLRPIGLIPTSESQARPLTQLAREEQPFVWQRAVESAPDGRVTAAHVQQVVDEYKELSKPHVSFNSGNNEWYTPAEYIEAARNVLGTIDLDPASSAEANTCVHARTYYTANDDGLQYPWLGNVWMNPPYASGLINQFVEKLAAHATTGDISNAIVLVNNATETEWFRQLINVATCVCFPQSRVKFWKPNGDTGAPLQGQAIIYIGSKRDSFLKEFCKFGWCSDIAHI